MDEKNKIYIDELNEINKKILMFWDSNIYTSEEQKIIKEKANLLNYYLVDSKLSNLIKIIESCKELIQRESDKFDNDNKFPLIILKENSINNEYIFKHPSNTFLMYKLIDDEVKNNYVVFLTKQATSYDKFIYLNYNDFIDADLSINEVEEVCNLDYLDGIKNYNINYLIPTFIDCMYPRIKYGSINESENIYILKSKKHEIKILLTEDVNQQNLNIFDYDLIIETNDNVIPRESILKESVINDIYKKYKNPIKSLGEI